MARLLVVEDDQKIGQMLQSALGANGHRVTWQHTGHGALAALDGVAFDLVLLDLGLPDLDGVEVCRELKYRQPQAVVVMLTARRDEMDVVVGLESGADDYLVKPFRMTELLARVRAHLRRGTTQAPPAEPARVDGLELDFAARRCLVHGIEVILRPKEFDLLARLVKSVGTAVSRQDLMSEVWDEHWHGSTKTLDVHVAALRARLEEAADRTEPPAHVPTITTLRGFGYRLDESASRARTRREGECP